MVLFSMFECLTDSKIPSQVILVETTMQNLTNHKPIAEITTRFEELIAPKKWNY